MHVGALSVFDGHGLMGADGRFRINEVVELVESRLHLIPRFRKIVQNVLLDAGEPIWVDDERFDIGYHVRLTALPTPGSRSQLLALFERIQSQVLDRSRPLWELWFVEGLEDGHVALIQKTHHALVDGVSGVDVATVLMDFSPEPTMMEAPKWKPHRAPTPARLFLDSVQSNITSPREAIRSLRRAVEIPQQAVNQINDLVRSLTSLATGGIIAPHTSLNEKVVGRSRRFGLARVSLSDVKLVRRAFGGTVNDVILAGVGGGLGRLLEERGELHPDLVLKVFCPVSVRDESEHMALGNRISAMFIPLAVGEPDSVTRLVGVQAVTCDLKEREQAVGAAVLLDLTQYAAPTVLGLAARLIHHQPFVNLVCTNVPGPQTPLYCMGARLLEAYPMVPLARNLNLGVAILSYCGELHFGLLGDRDLWPDMEVLEAGIDDAFSEMAKRAVEELTAREEVFVDPVSRLDQ